jgi:hypothetical protein
MNALEQLREIGPLTISRQTHISIEEIQAILDERYDRFNRTKAVGFVKILEREYDIDLQEWLEAFDEHNGDRDETEEIFVYAKSEEAGFPRMATAIAILLFVLAVGYYFWSAGSVAPVTPANQTSESALVGEAKGAIESSEEPQEETLSPVEVETTEIALEEPARIAFYVESDVDLWVGSYYSGSGQREGRIIKGRYDLDASADQVITFGHGHFTLVYGDQRFSPGNDQLQRFRLRDGVLTQMASPRPARSNRDTDANESAE